MAGVVGLDCAAANAAAYDRLRPRLVAAARPRVGFGRHDFSTGLDPLADGSFDHAVSGLPISYAESFDPNERAGGPTAAYDRLLGEVYRVLRPGGRFVFSVNVPEPSWAGVALPVAPGRGAARPAADLPEEVAGGCSGTGGG